jgi:hypothetical protein
MGRCHCASACRCGCTRHHALRPHAVVRPPLVKLGGAEIERIRTGPGRGRTVGRASVASRLTASPGADGPWVRPFPPRPPPEVAFHCSIASTVLWASSDFSSAYMLGVRLLPSRAGPAGLRARVRPPRSALPRRLSALSRSGHASTLDVISFCYRFIRYPLRTAPRGTRPVSR